MHLKCIFCNDSRLDQLINRVERKDVGPFVMYSVELSVTGSVMLRREFYLCSLHSSDESFVKMRTHEFIDDAFGAVRSIR